GNNESTRKHTVGTTRKGDRWLRKALTEIALAEIGTKKSAFGASHRRVMRHRGHKKALSCADRGTRTITRPKPTTTISATRLGGRAALSRSSMASVTACPSNPRNERESFLSMVGIFI